MLGINFEKNSRPKDQVRNYIEEEIATHKYLDQQEDFDSDTAIDDKFSESSDNSLDYYDDGNRFEVKEQMSNLLAMRPGPEKDKALFELKETFLWQQKGLAALKDELFKEIGAGGNINSEKIIEIIAENDKIYRFSWIQMAVIKNMAKDFLRRNRNVNDFFDKNFRNPNNIYRQFYNTEPIGKVELHRGPISLALICSDKEDYARMYANDHSGRRDLGEKEKKEADATAGFFSWSSPVNFPELRGTIIGVKKSIYSDVSETIDHEEQHAINKTYLDNIRPLRKEGLSSVLYSCDNKEQMRDAISSYCHYLIYHASNKVKDEILAFKAGERDDNYVIKTLTQRKKSGGIYDYFDLDEALESIESICINETLKQYQSELLDLAKKILKDEYRTLIKKGVAAVNNLKNKNYSYASITAILMPQVLENWLKTAERTKFSDDYSKVQNELRNVAPSDEVEKLADLKHNLSEQ